MCGRLLEVHLGDQSCLLLLGLTSTLLLFLLPVFFYLLGLVALSLLVGSSKQGPKLGLQSPLFLLSHRQVLVDVLDL